MRERLHDLTGEHPEANSTEYNMPEDGDEFFDDSQSDANYAPILELDEIYSERELIELLSVIYIHQENVDFDMNILVKILDGVHTNVDVYSLFEEQKDEVKSESGVSSGSFEKISLDTAYVASVTENISSRAKQTSSASDCAKYLNEIRDTLVESKLTGEVYKEVLEELDELIVRVEGEEFADELDQKRVRQIEVISHRIDRMCQRQS